MVLTQVKLDLITILRLWSRIHSTLPRISSDLDPRGILRLKMRRSFPQRTQRLPMRICCSMESDSNKDSHSLGIPWQGRLKPTRILWPLLTARRGRERSRYQTPKLAHPKRNSVIKCQPESSIEQLDPSESKSRSKVARAIDRTSQFHDDSSYVLYMISFRGKITDTVASFHSEFPEPLCLGRYTHGRTYRGS